MFPFEDNELSELQLEDITLLNRGDAGDPFPGTANKTSLENAGKPSTNGPIAFCNIGMTPEQITLAKVIRLIEGPLAPVSCVSEKFYERCSCPSEEKCGIRSIMKEVRDAIVRILDGVTVADLCARVRQLQGKHANPLDYII